jgi:hypothetical protein
MSVPVVFNEVLNVRLSGALVPFKFFYNVLVMLLRNEEMSRSFGLEMATHAVCRVY